MSGSRICGFIVQKVPINASEKSAASGMFTKPMQIQVEKFGTHGKEQEIRCYLHKSGIKE